MKDKNIMLCLSLLDKYNVEGNKFHYNKGEKDITTPLGIYKGVNETAEVFKVVDKWYNKLTGKVTNSKDYTSEDIKILNTEYGKKEEFYTEVMESSVEFYKRYFGKIDLDKFNSYLLYPFFNIYVNSRKVAVKAMQMTYCNVFDKEEDKKTCDGIYGPTTDRFINTVNETMNASDDTYKNKYITSIFLKNVLRCYIDMCTDNGRDDAQLPNLRGWTNRVNNIYKHLFNSL